MKIKRAIDYVKCYYPQNIKPNCMGNVLGCPSHYLTGVKSYCFERKYKINKKICEKCWKQKIKFLDEVI